MEPVQKHVHDNADNNYHAPLLERTTDGYYDADTINFKPHCNVFLLYIPSRKRLVMDGFSEAYDFPVPFISCCQNNIHIVASGGHVDPGPYYGPDFANQHFTHNDEVTSCDSIFVPTGNRFFMTLQ